MVDRGPAARSKNGESAAMIGYWLAANGITTPTCRRASLCFEYARAARIPDLLFIIFLFII
ncbi:MAG TPA: hypothetical protein H9811_09735 [Candidatus Gemmiger excrementigallinarum]|uniref:Uncharacterized protein n=1 Tax=Candidatus Gemmiger excrementigallinarum TaxID=2838609 RepID=A0A9D2ESG0_9FIRM|nr:hypothetical protein [Candidatus Gemmiger excrementigallinarum]